MDPWGSRVRFQSHVPVLPWYSILHPGASLASWPFSITCARGWAGGFCDHVSRTGCPRSQQDPILSGSHLHVPSQRPDFTSRDVQKHRDSVSSLPLHPMTASISSAALPKQPHRSDVLCFPHTLAPRARSGCTVTGTAAPRVCILWGSWGAGAPAPVLGAGTAARLVSPSRYKMGGK